MNKDTSKRKVLPPRACFSVGRGVPMGTLGISVLYGFAFTQPGHTHTSHTHILIHTVYNLEIKKPFQVQMNAPFHQIRVT